MKKFLRWAVMPVVAMAMALSFTACGDDAEDADGDDLEGAWYCVEEKFTDLEEGGSYNAKVEYKKYDGEYYPSKVSGAAEEGIKMEITSLGEERVKIKVYYCEYGDRSWELEESGTGYVHNGKLYFDEDDEDYFWTISKLSGDKMTLVIEDDEEKSESKWERK